MREFPGTSSALPPIWPACSLLRSDCLTDGRRQGRTKWGRKRTQITINEVDRARFPSRSPIQQGGATVLKQVAIMMFMAHIRKTELVAEKFPRPKKSLLVPHHITLLSLPLLDLYASPVLLFLARIQLPSKDGTNKTNDR